MRRNYKKAGGPNTPVEPGSFFVHLQPVWSTDSRHHTRLESCPSAPPRSSKVDGWCHPASSPLPCTHRPTESRIPTTEDVKKIHGRPLKQISEMFWSDKKEPALPQRQTLCSHEKCHGQPPAASKRVLPKISAPWVPIHRNHQPKQLIPSGTEERKSRRSQPKVPTAGRPHHLTQSHRKPQPTAPPKQCHCE